MTRQRCLRWSGRDGQAVDVQKRTDPAYDEHGPSKIHDRSKDKVRAQIPQLEDGRRGRDTPCREYRQVREHGAADERRQHDGPVREGLAREMREDDLGRHAAEDKRHGEAEQHEPLLAQQRGVR